MVTKVMIIRHAERPDKEGKAKGVTAEGKHDDGSLTVQGWQRAGALAIFFSKPDVASGLEVLAVIYASRPDPDAGVQQAAARDDYTAREQAFTRAGLGFPQGRGSRTRPSRPQRTRDRTHLLATRKNTGHRRPSDQGRCTHCSFTPVLARRSIRYGMDLEAAR